MTTLELSKVSEADERAVAAIAAQANVNLKDCYQCGKCSAGCPMIEGMDLMPRQVVRYLQLGLIDEVLRAKTPWVCAQCLVCSARCPQEVNIAELMRAVRHASKDKGLRPVPESDIFDDEFISNVSKHGVSNEQYLAMKYNMKSGHLMQDVANSPKMFALGMIGIKTHNIQGRGDVKALINRVLKRGCAKSPEGQEAGDAL